MSLPTLVIEILVENPDAGVVMGLSVYLLYEIRMGKLEDFRMQQKQTSQQIQVLGVALYKVVQRDEELDEEQYRDLLWEDEKDVFPGDLKIEDELKP